MQLEKLNSIAVAFYANPTDDLFRELYEEATRVFRRVNRAMVAQSGKGDENDADELFDKAILALSREDDIQDFGRVMSSRLRLVRTEFFRNESRRRKRYELTIDNREEGVPTSEPVADDDTEGAVILRLDKKKEADQRQLIDFLRSCKTDATTSAIVTATLEAPPSASALQIAKSIGLHHETANRKLTRLSRLFDSNRFGDIASYLPDGPRLRREFIPA